MIIIDHSRHHLNAFDVKVKEPGFGRGWMVTAANIDEVKLAIEHYYSRGHGNLDIPGCPICVDRLEYTRKQQRKR